MLPPDAIFKPKMHDIRFWLGSLYSAPPDHLAGFKGPTSKGRDGREGQGRTERRGEGKGREAKGGMKNTQGSFRAGTHRNAVPVLFFDHRNAVPVLFGI